MRKRKKREIIRKAYKETKDEEKSKERNNKES